MTTTGNTYRKAPGLLTVIAGIGVVVQFCALIFYVWAAQDWSSQGGGGYAGHAYSYPVVQTGITVAAIASAVVATATCGALAGLRNSAIAWSSVGLTSSAVLTGAITWTMSVPEPEPGLAMLFYDLAVMPMLAQGVGGLTWFSIWLVIRARER